MVEPLKHELIIKQGFMLFADDCYIGCIDQKLRKRNKQDRYIWRAHTRHGIMGVFLSKENATKWLVDMAESQKIVQGKITWQTNTP